MTRLPGFCLMFGLVLPSAAEEPIAFRFQKDVPRSASEEVLPIVAAILDSQVYFTAKEGFPDLRVFDDQGAEVPFLLEKATAVRHDTVRTTGPGKDDRKSEYPIVEFERTDDEKEKQTVITLTTQREPLTSFTLETTSRSRNFSRRAAVEVALQRGVRTEWVRIGRATLSMTDVGGYNRENLLITFPETREAQYRIVIDNQDNRPLEITDVKAQGNVYRMLFFAPETGTCRVYYGSEIAERPTYESANVLVGSGKDDLAAEVLGTETANPAFGEPPGLAVRKLLGNSIFLGGAICVVVGVLTWILLRAGRRIDQITADETSE